MTNLVTDVFQTCDWHVTKLTDNDRSMTSMWWVCDTLFWIRFGTGLWHITKGSYIAPNTFGMLESFWNAVFQKHFKSVPSNVTTGASTFECNKNATHKKRVVAINVQLVRIFSIFQKISKWVWPNSQSGSNGGGGGVGPTFGKMVRNFQWCSLTIFPKVGPTPNPPS